jgi:hypothetical protein
VVNEAKTETWWLGLRAIAVFNIALWAATAAMTDADTRFQQQQLALCAVFVLVCAFRSFWPRIDLERTCLVDSPLSSMFLGRSAATIAELCFAAQVALWLDAVGAAAGLVWVESFALAVVPLLGLAQCFCWSSVLTLSHLGHAIEESLWGATMGAVGACLAFCAPHLEGLAAQLCWLSVGLAAVYVAFMASFDVPMYLRRWRAGRAKREPILALGDGLSDCLTRRHATRCWEVWRPEVAWLTGYFSVAVWLSLALVHLPRP